MSDWRTPTEALVPLHVPLLCAWRHGNKWSYGIAKFTGKRWLDVMPETANEVYCVPDRWQRIEQPT